jgi:hypothetical protein
LGSNGSARFRFFAVDNESYPSDGEVTTDDVFQQSFGERKPDAILYATRVDGGSWSAWSQQPYFSGEFGVGGHTFDVKAKDEADNESAVVSRSFEGGAASHASRRRLR